MSNKEPQNYEVFTSTFDIRYSTFCGLSASAGSLLNFSTNPEHVVDRNSSRMLKKILLAGCSKTLRYKAPPSTSSG
jgi:hypothetical protein